RTEPRSSDLTEVKAWNQAACSLSRRESGAQVVMRMVRTAKEDDQMTLANSSPRLVCLIGLACCALPPTLAMAAEDRPNRMKFEYVPPTNPAHQHLYELVKRGRLLEKLQEVFSPLRLPIDLTLRTIGCDGVSNAWYHRPDVSVCYEYLDEIYQTMPKETTAAG